MGTTIPVSQKYYITCMICILVEYNQWDSLSMGEVLGASMCIVRLSAKCSQLYVHEKLFRSLSCNSATEVIEQK